jgi:Rrf2 family transcriptional regulator, nitric oxide-sensitive transcriptional repressor
MLSQTADYALRAAVHLGQAYPRSRTTRQIAKATGVPSGYLAKVLQALSRAGLVTSQRGVHGGFVLQRPPKEMSALEVLEVVDPVRRIRSCPLKLPEHSEQLCRLHRQLDDAIAGIETAFRNSSIADLSSTDPAHAPLCELRSNGESTSVDGENPDDTLRPRLLTEGETPR